MGLGLVASPGSMPSADDLAALRPAFLRSIVYSYRDVERLVSLGLPLMLMVNSEMQEVGGGATWEDALEGIVKRSRGRVFCVTAWNELDILGESPEFAASLVRRAAPILHAAGIKVACTSVASGNWQDYLARVAELCGDVMDYADLHPYGQRPDGFARPGWGFGDLRPALIRAYELAGRPVICSEIGVKVGDAGGEDAVADFLRAADSTIALLGTDVCPYAAWFAWHDAVGGPSERGDQAFGLMSENGYRRPAWDAFAAVGGGDVVTPPDPLPAPVQIPPDVGWVGSGLQAELDRLGWTPTSDEHDETLRLVRAGDDLVVWDQERGALAYRRG